MPHIGLQRIGAFIIFPLLSVTSHIQEDKKCISPACFEAASAIKSDMDGSINPCDNFYQYACGGYDESHDEGYEEIVWNKMSNFKKDIKEGKISIPGFRTQKLMIDFQNSCMNESKIETIGLSPAQNILQAIGGWPVVTPDWNNKTFKFHSTMFKLWGKGVYLNNLINIYTPTKSHGETVNVDKDTIERLRIDCSTVGEEFFLYGNYSKRNAEAYYQFMNKTASLFGADPVTSTKDMRDVWDFERKIMNRSCDPDEVGQKMTLQEMDSNFPMLNWTEYISEYLAPFSPIYQSLPVYVMAPNNLRYITSILNETSSRIIGNFIGWSFIKQHPQYLNKNLTEIYREFCKITGCVFINQPRQKTCNEIFKKIFRLSDEFGFMYEKLYVQPKTVAAARNMTKDIQNEMRWTVSTRNFLGGEDQLNFIDKMNKTYLISGFQPEWNTSLIDDLYKELNMDEKSFYLNVLNGISFIKRHSDRSRDNKGPYEDILRNNDTFIDPPYVLFDKSPIFYQNIFFNETLPRCMNFAGLGASFPRLILNSYDDYIFEGEQSNFTKNAIACFEKNFKEMQIFQDEGDQPDWEAHEYDILRVAGAMNLGYRAYLRSIGENQDDTLPNLNITSRELFWLNTARIFCKNIHIGAESPEDIEKLVNYQFFTNKHFRTDWKCLNVSETPIKQTCELW